MFRPEVTESRKQEWLGTISLAAPMPYKLLAAFSALSSGILLLLLIFGHYTRHEQAQGELVPSSGLLTVVAPSAGIVSRVLVRPGAKVVEGQALVELSTELDSVAVGNTRAMIADELRQQRARLESELSNQKLLTEQRQDDARAHIRILGQEIAQIDSQSVIQREQIASAVEVLEKIQPLAGKGYISGLEMQQHKSAVLSAQAELMTLNRQRSEKQDELSKLTHDLSEMPLLSAADASELQRKIADSKASLAQAEGQRAIVLRAQRSGTLADAVAKEGQSVAVGQRLFSILPAGSSLEVELWLPSRSIGFVERGSRVALRYQAFPYQHFGLQFGRVIEISPSAVSAAELSSTQGRKFDEPQYRVTVRLDNQSVVAYGKPEMLHPGMAVDADILLDHRSLIEWVLEPIYGYGRRIGAGHA